ncbi:MAG: glycosyltransferase family 1 protein [Acidobacteriota bacterium]
MTMTVGVVGTELEGRRSGVGRSLEGLLGGALELGRDDVRFRVYLEGQPFDHPLWDAATVEPIFDRRLSRRPVVWEQTRLPWRLRSEPIDLLFSPSYSLPPFLGVPSVLTLHDLSFEHLPSEFGWRERWRRCHLARIGARRATRVLTVSTWIAEDLERTYGLDADKIAVVPNAVDRAFFSPPPDAAARVAALGVPPEAPYVLFVGSILPRRRLDLVLDAFAVLIEDDPHLRLVIAGSDRLGAPGRLAGWIGDRRLEDRVDRLDYVAEDALASLYAEARASIYVSTYEGFGIPPLESFAAGTPAVTSLGMAIDDLGPEPIFRADRLETDAIAEALRRALDDPRRDAHVAAVRSKLRATGWARCAGLLLDELERAVREHGR